MDVISYQRYVEMCRAKQHFVGYVAGLGQVLRWEPVSVAQDYSPTAPCFLSNGNTFQTAIYLPVIIPERSVQTTPFLNAGQYAGWGGTAASAASLSNKPLILGSEYVRINSGGTLIRNANRTYTNTGAIAGNIGKRITWFAGGMDIIAASRGEQSWKQAGTSIAINYAIMKIGVAYPPVGLALGIIYLIAATAAHAPIPGQKAQYENGIYIHPKDNTKVEPVSEKLPSIPKKKIFPAYDPPEINPKR